MNYIKYDKYIKSILIKDLDLSNEPIWVNIAYESDRKTLLKMGGKGICTSIKCSVGQFALAGGIFFEIQYHTSGIRLSQITVVFN